MQVEQFLEQMSTTANTLDFDAHMNLISKDVSVFGVPGFEVIGYQDWYNQCKEEFEKKVLKSVSYQGLKVLEQSPDKIMFKSIETVEATDGTVNRNNIEFIIQKELDDVWRVSQERILPAEEHHSDN